MSQLDGTNLFAQVDINHDPQVEIPLHGVWLVNAEQKSAGDIDQDATPFRHIVVPEVVAPIRPEIRANSTPLQIWEGVVTSINSDRTAFQAVLEAKLGDIPPHSVEIDFEWVSPQDLDLVTSGAVFYLTLYKRVLPSIENTQELRFRRRPAWSATQVRNIHERGEALRRSIFPARQAE